MYLSHWEGPWYISTMNACWLVPATHGGTPAAVHPRLALVALSCLGVRLIVLHGLYHCMAWPLFKAHVMTGVLQSTQLMSNMALPTLLGEYLSVGLFPGAVTIYGIDSAANVTQANIVAGKVS